MLCRQQGVFTDTNTRCDKQSCILFAAPLCQQQLVITEDNITLDVQQCIFSAPLCQQWAITDNATLQQCIFAAPLCQHRNTTVQAQLYCGNPTSVSARTVDLQKYNASAWTVGWVGWRVASARAWLGDSCYFFVWIIFWNNTAGRMHTLNTQSFELSWKSWHDWKALAWWPSYTNTACHQVLTHRCCVQTIQTTTQKQ